MANLGGQGSQLGVTGDPGLGQRTFLEPGSQSVQIDGRRSGQMLQMGLGQSPVAALAQAEASYPLGDGSLHPSPRIVEFPTSLGC